MSSTLIRQIQAALDGLGWDPGPIDGDFGPATAKAAREFAASPKGLPDTSVEEATIEREQRSDKASLRVGIVIGHTPKAPGAVRVTDGEAEYPWNSRLAQEIRKYLVGAGHQADIFHRRDGLAYGAQIREVYAATDRWGADVTVELHFNGAAAASATGTETLSSGSAGSLRVAKSVQARMVAALGLRDRGILVRKRTDRGGESLHAGRAPAILTEPYFGSNASDCNAADAKFKALAAAIAEGALDV